MSWTWCLASLWCNILKSPFKRNVRNAFGRTSVGPIASNHTEVDLQGCTHLRSLQLIVCQHTIFEPKTWQFIYFKIDTCWHWNRYMCMLHDIPAHHLPGSICSKLSPYPHRRTTPLWKRGHFKRSVPLFICKERFKHLILLSIRSWKEITNRPNLHFQALPCTSIIEFAQPGRVLATSEKEESYIQAFAEIKSAVNE